MLREEELDELDDVEAAEERRATGAGVGALLRIDSDLFRDPDPGCAWAAFSGWKRVGVSKWTGILVVGFCLLIGIVMSCWMVMRRYAVVLSTALCA